MNLTISRRGFVVSAMTAPFAFPAQAQGPSPAAQLGAPPTVISNPPRQFGPDAPPSIAPDPDVLVIDPAFAQLRISQAPILRVATGYEFTEGPAWSSQGCFFVFSDVKTDTQYRYIWETGQVTTYRRPSFASNGNTFDHEGREISTQNFFRRVVRWEHDGSLKVLADNYKGTPLNSPNDVVPHPDGSVWFTDPRNGGNLAEGHPDLGEGSANPGGFRDPRIGDLGTGLIGGLHQTLPANVYRVDPTGRVDLVLPFEEGLGPNGLCFSPDYKKLYVIRAGRIGVADVNGGRLSAIRPFSDCVVDGVRCAADGMRADRMGNLWVGSTSVLGYAGVTVWDAAGKLLGRIRLPESCANVCFAGPKRDYLVMTASHSVYLLHVNIQGASPG